MSAPIILVPGFWLGAWAWDEVADMVRADGHAVTALTLPGLEAADVQVVLAARSATGYSGCAASDRVPERIAAIIGEVAREGGAAHTAGGSR